MNKFISVHEKSDVGEPRLILIDNIKGVIPITIKGSDNINAAIYMKQKSLPLYISESVQEVEEKIYQAQNPVLMVRIVGSNCRCDVK